MGTYGNLYWDDWYDTELCNLRIIYLTVYKKDILILNLIFITLVEGKKLLGVSYLTTLISSKNFLCLKNLLHSKGVL